MHTYVLCYRDRYIAISPKPHIDAKAHFALVGNNKFNSEFGAMQGDTESGDGMLKAEFDMGSWKDDGTCLPEPAAFTANEFKSGNLEFVIDAYVARMS